MNNQPRLLCIPGAGASAARFERTRQQFVDLVEVRTFELPGRGIRFAEPSLKLLTEHFSHFIDRIEAEPYQRWILMGESLGALTSAWLASELADSMRAEVIGVITVAAAPGATGRRPRAEVMELLKADAARLDPTGKMPMAAETILADIDAAHAVADEVKLFPLEVPLATIRGVEDGLISDEGARRWEGLAGDRWLYQEVPGNHYQFEQPSQELMQSVRTAIGFISGTS
ncbi:MAG: thioesterase II family protein [Acidimicrobiales bacterium]